MTKLTENKTFQVIVGAGTLWLAWVLYRDGWLDWLRSGRDDQEGFSNTQLWVAIGSAVISFLQMVGIATIAIASGVLPHCETMLTFAAEQLKKLAATARDFITKNNNRPTADGESWDWRPLAVIILSWVLWSGGQLQTIWDSLINVIPDSVDVITSKPAAILFSVDPETATDGQLAVASSVLVEDMMQKAGVERRMYSSHQDQEVAEAWVGQAMQAAPDDDNVLVLYYQNGQIEILDAPDSIQEMEDIAGGW